MVEKRTALDFESVYSEASAAAFAGGKRRFYDNRVQDIALVPSGTKNVLKGRIAGEKERSPEITFDEQGGLYDYGCDCGAELAAGPCKHVVALALSAEGKFDSVAGASVSAVKPLRSDTAALGLITEYTKRKHIRYKISDSVKVNLEPIFIIKNDHVWVRFMIGRSKSYILRDISDFVSCVLGGGFRRYGVELELFHYTENFNERSIRLIRLLSSAYKERIDNIGTLENRGELRLSLSDVDEFYDLLKGGTARFDESAECGGTRLLTAEEDSLCPDLAVEDAEGGFKLFLKLGAYKVVAGKKFYYVVTDERVYRVSEGYYARAHLFFKTFDSFNGLFIAEKDMPVFYNNVLASVSGIVNVVSQTDLTGYEAAPLVTKLYLDLAAGLGLAGRLECSYDDVEVSVLDDGASVGAVRDWESENALKAVLAKYFPEFPVLTLTDEHSVYRMMNYGLSELFGYADIYLSSEVKKMKVRKPPKIRVGVRLESDLLKLDLLAEQYSSEELLAVLSAYREGSEYIRLNDGAFVDLSDPSIGALGEVLELAGGDGKTLSLPKYYAPFLDTELKNGFFSLERDKRFKELIASLTGAENLDIEVPASLKGILRNYQKAGFRWLKTLKGFGFGGILADDMGLGKSLQVISLLLSEPGGVSIIVCPTTLILNWVNEFKKFAPDLKVLPVMGTFSERKVLTSQIESCDVVVTSYELIRRDESLYGDIRFRYAIVDEAQYIKNPETKNARAVKTLKSDYRFALTGTPIENSLAELWSIFDFIMPGYLYSYGRFKESFETEIIKGNEKVAQRLKKLVQPFVLRRLKSAVLKELPPKVETRLNAPLEDGQRELYLANLNLIRESVRSQGEGVNKIVVLSMLTKLRQICCEPRLAFADYTGNSAKLDMCLQLLESATQSGHKVLLFSQFTSMLEIIRARLAEMGVTHYVLKGDTPKTERMRLVNRFNSDKTEVFLISLKAGGTGLNLTGADVVIHYDPWWNESVMNQATDRAYRLGQDKSVQVYKLILDDTIEEKILKLQEKKNALSSLVVGGEGAISYDELMELLA